MYSKNNIAQEAIAELLFVSQSVISETISLLDGLMVKVLKEFEPDMHEEIAGRVSVIDGSLHPCWSWRSLEGLWPGKTQGDRSPARVRDRSRGRPSVHLGSPPGKDP